jgi:hypothetical protein
MGFALKHEEAKLAGTCSNVYDPLVIAPFLDVAVGFQFK